ncbi:MAG: endo-1,4-beta-xylanase [Spirochaetes bacterium]|nr:endo-1,4-beta-xylanase [Spirochaetota bacterium]MBU0955153.1 endo-1,4-beta-xylanase [Spirochaetota bacterium]
MFINEYGIEQSGEKLEGLLSLLDELLAAGVPIDGVGFQCHTSIDEEFSPSELGQAMDAVIAKGLEVQITELDVRINDDQTGKSSQKLAAQAELFGAIASEAAQRYPECSALVLWGLSDADSYVNHSSWLSQDKDWPHPYDENFMPKPAFQALYQALSRP